MKQLSARAFLRQLLILTLALVFLAGAVMFAVDPYFHYRASEDAAYVLLDRFCLPGMVRGFDYDAVLVGSSMCQNFNMDLMEEVLGGEILKATKGGLTIGEADAILSWIREAGRADTVYFSLELTRFNTPEPEESYYPDYLTNASLADDFRYLYGYEAWMRALPMDAVTLTLDALNLPLPQVLREKTEADEIGRWAQDASYPGEAALVESYLSGGSGVSAQNAEGMAQRMKESVDAWLSSEPFDPNITYYFFSAPYSALYWTHLAREGTLDAVLELRTYFFERLSQYDNVIAFDFQGLDQIQNLDLYKDITHYHESINDRMTRLLAAGEYRATEERVEETNAFLRDCVRALCEKYPALLPADA